MLTVARVGARHRINTKLGGVNSIAANDILMKIQTQPIMIVGPCSHSRPQRRRSLHVLSISYTTGADVGHAGPGMHEQPSITSLVASYDSNVSQYAAFVQVQRPRQEIIENLAGMMQGALVHFVKQNNVLPDIIVFFRDGVSEGEYEAVRESECGQIQSAPLPPPLHVLPPFFFCHCRHCIQCISHVFFFGEAFPVLLFLTTVLTPTLFPGTITFTVHRDLGEGHRGIQTARETAEARLHRRR